MRHIPHCRHMGPKLANSMGFITSLQLMAWLCMPRGAILRLMKSSYSVREAISYNGLFWTRE
jgi:hypothetical protein